MRALNGRTGREGVKKTATLSIGTLLSSIAIVAIVSCGGRENVPNACVPGQQLECSCPDGAKGAQACRADGTGFDVCTCVGGMGGMGGAGTGGTGSGGAAGSGGVAIDSAMPEPDANPADDVNEGGASFDRQRDDAALDRAIPDASSETIRPPGDAACAGQPFIAEGRQTDFFMMMDSSGSMETLDMGQTASRWDNLATAIRGFVNDAANAGMLLGLDFFPEGGASPLCNVTDYTNVDVPMGELPMNANAIITALNGRMRFGGTPTGPALQGAIQSARTYQVANPSRTLGVLLLTDGQPTGCGVSTANPTGPAVMAAQAGATGMPPIKTYVFGIGPETGNLDAIAAAGGTTKAYLATSSSPTDVAKALADIRKSSQGCDYQIPKPEGGTLDPYRVNVSVREGTSGNFFELSYVVNAQGCNGNPNNPQGFGWYYDNSFSPTKITLCPNTCGPLQAADGSQVNVVLGCPTKVIPPPN